MSQLKEVLPDSAFTDLLSNYLDSEDCEDLLQLIQSEEKYLLKDHSLKLEINSSPQEIQSLTHDLLNSEELQKDVQQINFSEIVENDQKDDPLQNYMKTLDGSCADCVRYEKLTTITQIKPGDHIRFHKCYNMYNHHAIVVETDHNKEEMTLVHFQKKDGSFKIVKESKEFDPSKNIDVVLYQNRPFSSNDIVERANKMVEEFKQNPEAMQYSLVDFNCESLSNVIAAGPNSSPQVSSNLLHLKSMFSWLLKLLLKLAVKVLRVLKASKSLIRGFAHIAVIASFFFLVEQMVMLKEKLKQGLICYECFTEQHNKLMTSLIFCLITVGISVIAHFSFLLSGICAALCLVLPVVVDIFIDPLMRWLQPAFKISKHMVKQKQMIKKGDIITFPYVGLFHEGIVTDILPISAVQSDVIQVTIVHYNYPGLFGTRTVVKEDFFFNLKKQDVYVYDFTGEKTYPSEEVVRRACGKIGTRKFNEFNNRSSHLCRSCKTGEPTLKRLEYKKANEIKDISPGDIINFSYCWMWHDAVVIQVQYSDTIQCNVIHYNYSGVWGTRTVVEELFTFRLENQDLFVHDYSLCEVNDPEDVVRLARLKVGDQNFNMITNRSSHLAKSCKLKK